MAETTYEYERDPVPGGYDCPANPARTDVEGRQIHLAVEIADALPGKVFKIIADGADCDVIFSEALDAADKTTLDAVVAAHKANT
jgi:hypothetical protein